MELIVSQTVIIKFILNLIQFLQEDVAQWLNKLD